jgi:hypothetical protein
MTQDSSEKTSRGEAPLEIIIRSDGRVAFRTFTEEMLKLALALAPDEPDLVARAARLRQSRERGADEASSDS